MDNKDIVVNNGDFVPTLFEDRSVLKGYNKIPLDKISAIGAGMTPVINAIEMVMNGAGGSGLYHVSVPNSGTMMSFKDGSGFLGSVKGPNGGVGGGQARLNQLPCDPSMIFMAATMFCMQMKLDAIQETQEEILQFLEKKEKAELKGNIVVLSDIIDNYKYNWDNEQFLNNNHNKVLDIKQKSEQSIILAQDRINSTLSKKQLIHLSTDVNSRTKKLNNAFEDYQLSMYAYAMASYVEAVLLKNFSKDYMNNIANKIEDYSIEYRELYTDCYNMLSQLEDSSVDTIVLGGIGKASRAAGKVIAKVPVVEKAELDEVLVGVGNILDDNTGSIKASKLQTLISKQSSYVTPYVDSIKMLGELHDKPLNLFFDKENIYIEKVAV